ncbi:hypothetical protein SAMN05444166_0995 [Singulisphaera sp. GP187]|uniref:hypothetical protein n=1 Tax=Singulisphaera sp. GP187 TaxID=1882752 RepID=UPI0009272C7F|nr:hypothetical protein [Singulisphaera sp. GP187]SIN80822.1 hypothetical protein SAMN05444166_0995 [Singulisphaera sp. GP187]
MRRYPAFAGALLLPLFTCSCGNGAPRDAAVYPVSGQVVVDGKPAQGVVVRFHLLNQYRDPDVPPPSARTDSSGRFQLKTEAGEPGAPAGQYVATFLWPAAVGGRDRLANAFAEPEESGFVALVEDKAVELPPFVLRMNRKR